MKTVISIFILVIMVSIQTPVGQFFKLPLLIEHFIKHQKQNGVSFIGFLNDHYSSGHTDNDLPEDNQLPFKNITFHTIGYAIVPGIIKATIILSFHGEKKVVFPETYAQQQHLASIFHPPKAATRLLLS